MKSMKTHIDYVSPMVLLNSHGAYRSALPGSSSSLCSAALPLNAAVCPYIQVAPPVGTSAAGWDCGAHVEHTYLTAQTQPRTESGPVL